MNSVRAVLLATVVICGTLVAAVPTTAGPTSSTDDATGVDSVQSTVQAVDENATTNESLGTEISSFMQVSSAEAQGAVETGMWVAEYNATGNQSAKRSLVDDKVTTLGKKLDSLQQEKQAIIDAYRNEKLTRMEYHAQMSGIVGRIQAVQQAINETEPRARAVGANVRAVEALGERANATIGPEVATVARSLGSVNVSNRSVTPNGTTPPGQDGNPGVVVGNSTGTDSAGVDGNDAGTGVKTGLDGGARVGNDTATDPSSGPNGGTDGDPGTGSGGGESDNPSMGGTGLLAPVETEIAP